MARLVIRNRDKVNRDDPDLNDRCTKRGMVIEILPDGMSLGTTGDKYDGWTVVEVPGVPIEALGELRLSHPDGKHRRAVCIDLDVLGTRRSLTMGEVLGLTKEFKPHR